MSQTRVLVADDHRLVRALIESYLSKRYLVLPGARCLADVDEAIQSGGFDVLLLAVSWDDGDSALLRFSDWLNSCPDLRILVCTAFDDWSLCANALAQGATGFLTKSSRLEELFTAIDAAANGHRYVSSVIKHPATRKNTSRQTDLSQQQWLILTLLAEGWTHAEIAATMQMHIKSVGYHVTQIRQKCGVPTGARGDWIALLAGGIDPPNPKSK